MSSKLEIRPSVTGHTTSQSFTRNNYGDMNTRSRIISVMNQARRGTWFTAQELCNNTQVTLSTVQRTLRSMNKDNLMNTKMATDGKTKLWTVKV